MNNSKNSAFWIPLVMAIFMAIGLYLGKSLAQPKEVQLSQGQSDYQKMNDIIRILDQRYVDSVNADQLFEETIADMLHKLDPHSNYISGKELLAMNEQIEGKFSGVGVRFFIIRDTLCITNVLPGSPSEKAGLLAGDKILEIDGKKVASKKLKNDDVMGLLKGDENTIVKLKVLRGKQKLVKEVVRGGIPIESVVAAYMIAPKVGFVRINSFSKTTTREFRSAAKKLLDQGMKKMILDVRSNGGGVLTGATEIADEFLPKGYTIVETKGEHFPPYKYKSTAVGLLEKTEVVILINESSASASEILAGAIQDNDRGTIVGRRSFGKGLVQEDVQLRDNSNLRLTIARYYTPTGRCIQKPYSDNYDDYYEDHRQRYENGELYKVDSTMFADSLKYKTPKGKIVYGGGGIMPDVFVPYDSSGTSWYFAELRYSDVFTTFAFDYIQGKRSQWKSAEDFNRSFSVTDALIRKLTDFAYEENQIPLDKSGLAQSRELIRRVLKSEIARQLYVEQGYFQVVNATDAEVKKALELLR